MSGVLDALEKVLTDANERAIAEFRTEAEEVKTRTLAELADKVAKAETYVAGLKPSKGDKGDNGTNYILSPSDKKEIARSIHVPVVEKVIEKTEIIKEQPIVKEVAKDIPGKEIIDKINDAPITWNSQIDASHIRGLPEDGGNRAFWHHGGGDIILGYEFDITDDSILTYTVPYHRKISMVFYSSAPYFFNSSEYTDTSTSMTFPSNTIASGQRIKILYTI